MKPITVPLFKGDPFLPPFAIMQHIDEFTTPEIEVEILTSAMKGFPPLQCIYEDISEHEQAISSLLFQRVLPYYYEVIQKNFGNCYMPPIQALVIRHCPLSEEQE